MQGNDAEQRLAFADAYRMLYNRISIFVHLPFASLHRLALQRRLDEIGEEGRARTEAAPSRRGPASPCAWKSSSTRTSAFPVGDGRLPGCVAALLNLRASFPPAS